MTTGLALVGCGAVTPVGLSAASTCAAVRAHISAYAESNLYHESFIDAPIPSFIDPPGPILHRIIHARVPTLAAEAQTDEFSRLVKLAASAVSECLQRSDSDPEGTGLILGLRERHREHPDLSGREREWHGAIESELGIRFHRASHTLAAGHTSVFQGLVSARQLLTERSVTTCIVAGIDSYLNVYDLERLVRTYRILGPTASRGFVPGEGVACVAVRLAQGAKTREANACILGIGLDAEDSNSTVLSDGHATGRGLERALERAVIDAQMPESSIELRISDLNGEMYRTDESLLAAARFYKTYRAHLEIWHPAECVGDMGAASGAMSLILGWAALSGGYAPGPVAMCESSSDAGRRAGCLIGLSDTMNL
jgi:3-oxoacyl-[acyl-carrier-protein] synthase-1